jgi:uncharacterized protein YndB with AHSA1/START domain
MTPTGTAAPAVHRTATVEVEQKRAFEIYTVAMGTWWPAEHHIGKKPFAKVIIEPRQGGRWLERDADGVECEWGSVLAWDPPQRVVVSWHLGDDWQYDSDPAHASEVEIRFTAEGPLRTRVDIEHRAFERHLGGGSNVRASVSSPEGWTLTLTLYNEAAGQQRP